jgi:predicted kinase
MLSTMKTKPTIVLMAGLPGTGKTTLALELSRRLGWVAVDKDTLKSALLQAGVTEELAGPSSYELMHGVAEDLVLRQGRSVILDSPGIYPITFRRANELAASAGGDLKIIVLLAGRDLRNERATARVSRTSQPRMPHEQDDDDGRRRFRHLPAEHLELTTDRDLEGLIQRALRYLEEPASI